MDFGATSIFTKVIIYTLRKEPSITIKYGFDDVFIIRSMDDVLLLNKYQANALKTINRIQRNVMSIVSKYDPKSQLNGSKITIYDKLYLLKFCRTNIGWNIYFYSEYNVRGLMNYLQLEEAEEKIYRLADTYSIEERLSSLFR